MDLGYAGGVLTATKVEPMVVIRGWVVLAAMLLMSIGTVASVYAEPCGDAASTVKAKEEPKTARAPLGKPPGNLAIAGDASRRAPTTPGESGVNDDMRAMALNAQIQRKRSRVSILSNVPCGHRDTAKSVIGNIRN